jgi:protoheme IX farnesyltransferase
MTPTEQAAAAAQPRTSRFLQAASPTLARDLWAMTKPEITFLVVLSTVAGFALGSPAGVDGWTLVWAVVGTALASAGGAVLNHWMERTHDAGMKRTADRPIPSGRVGERTAFGWGVVLASAGVGILCPLVNPPTGLLAILTLALYLWVYTPLKRRTPLNTLVGTVPGALPALGGFVAATGTFGAPGWAVFALLVAWQVPHFMALAWMYRKDYARGGFAMATVTDETGDQTALWIAGGALATVGLSLLPWTMGLTTPVYAACALLLGIYFGRPALAFWSDRTGTQARAVLKASVLYIPLLVAALVADLLWLS